MATVYRMLNVLEEIGAVDRRSYQMVEEEKESVSIIFNHGETDEKNRELYQKIKRVLRKMAVWETRSSVWSSVLNHKFYCLL